MAIRRVHQTLIGIHIVDPLPHSRASPLNKLHQISPWCQHKWGTRCHLQQNLNSWTSLWSSVALTCAHLLWLGVYSCGTRANKYQYTLWSSECPLYHHSQAKKKLVSVSLSTKCWNVVLADRQLQYEIIYTADMSLHHRSLETVESSDLHFKFWRVNKENCHEHTQTNQQETFRSWHNSWRPVKSCLSLIKVPISKLHLRTICDTCACNQ